MKRLLTTLVILTGLIGSAEAVWAQDFNKGLKAAQSGDFATAMKWLRKAAEQGHAGAQFWVGTLYKGGNGVTQDYAEAVKWFRKAAEQGDTQGQNNIGQMYRKGEGVTQDYQEARKWFRKAAEKGDSTGQNNLGVLYDNGWGVTRDTVAAFMWFDIAVANRGESHRVRRDSGNFWGIAARKLSSADIVEAQKRAKRCMASDYKDCDIGSAGAVRADAQSDAVKGLKAYQAGDYAEAMKWLRKAAEQGHAGAQVNLGVMYAKGEGVLQDTIAAHMWFNIAAANGSAKGVKGRDIAAGKLSSSGVEEAQQMAKRCMASGYKDCD